jgi:ubiquinone/menaquinone biosynthesis C-methylase UbiE
MLSEAETIRGEYDRLATRYDRRWRSYLAGTLSAVVESVDLHGEKLVLDVACGTGELERGLLARWPGLRVVGIDLSQGMLGRAAMKVGDAQVAWAVANSKQMPFSDGVFDHVICANSFHYFRAPEQALREMRRVLKPRGTLVIVDWCDDYLSCKLCSLWLKLTDPAFGRMYGMDTLGCLVKQAGFELEDSHHFRVGWTWGMMRLVCRRIA